jgi:hypothetical protein
MFRGFMVVGLLGISMGAAAHGGGLDKNGCHHDRKNGGYHCHRGAPADAAALRPDSRALQPNGAGTTYGSCAEARAAGAAPVRRGDPGYSRRLDRDGDGVGCE